MYSISFQEQHAALPPGNGLAIRQVFDLYYVPLCHFASRIIDDLPAAKDIVSETFVKLWELYDRFDSEEPIRAFLFKVVQNACFNFLKKSRRNTVRLKELQYQLVHDEEHTNNELMLAMVLQYIYTELEQLPVQQQKICKLILLNNMNVKEVATRLNISEQTVRNQKARAIRHVRAAVLKKLEGVPEPGITIPYY